MLTEETQRLQSRYAEKLEDGSWTEENLRILNTAIADRLQIELPGNQVPLYPTVLDKEND